MGQMSDVAEAAPADLSTAEKFQRVGQGAARGGLMSLGQRNAQAWNAPGGGYNQWQAGDAQREQQFPPGTPVNNPALPPVPGARKPLNPFWGQ